MIQTTRTIKENLQLFMGDEPMMSSSIYLNTEQILNIRVQYNEILNRQSTLKQKIRDSNVAAMAKLIQTHINPNKY